MGHYTGEDGLAILSTAETLLHLQREVAQDLVSLVGKLAAGAFCIEEGLRNRFALPYSRRGGVSAHGDVLRCAAASYA